MSDRDDFTTDGAQGPEDGMDEIDRHARIVAQLGGDRCAKMYTAYRRGLDHENVQSHIVSCSLCSFMLEDKIRERAAQERAAEIIAATTSRAVEDRRLARRRFIKVGAIVTVAIGLVAAGVGYKFRVTKKPPPPNSVNQLAVLDAAYATGGSGVLVSRLNPLTGTEADALLALSWIEERQAVAEYGLLVGAFSDLRSEVKIAAVAHAMSVRPADLKPHQSVLDTAASTETNARLKVLMKELADTVRRS